MTSHGGKKFVPLGEGVLLLVGVLGRAEEGAADGLPALLPAEAPAALLALEGDGAAEL